MSEVSYITVNLHLNDLKGISEVNPEIGIPESRDFRRFSVGSSRPGNFEFTQFPIFGNFIYFLL